METKKTVEERIEDIMCQDLSTFEQLELLRDLDTEILLSQNIKTWVEASRAGIESRIKSLVNALIDNGICPCCGCELDFEANGCDTYVPYGDTRVLFDRGGENVCYHCGWRE